MKDNSPESGSFKELVQLFIEFTGFGFTTFGGGWSLITQMQQLYVEKKQTVSAEELLDLTSVARSLPGMVVTNICFLFGYHLRGLLGAFTCLLGLALPPVVLMMALTFCYDAISANPYVMAAMQGVRAAVVPIILSAALALFSGAFRYRPCYLVLLLSFGLYTLTSLNCFWLIVIGMLCGVVISRYYEAKEPKEAENDSPA